MDERTIVSFDYAIKYLLRDKADFGILSGFLSELLRRKVEVQAILESETNKSYPDAKVNRVDLKAQIDGLEFAVFEIQFRETIDFFSKVLFGVSKAIVEQVSAGSNLYNIKKVYSINISYYNFDAKREYLFTCKAEGFRGVHYSDEMIPFAQACDLADAASAKMAIHPEYYLILPEMFDERQRGGFNEWMYLLKKSAVRSGSTADGIEEASLKLDLLKMSASERRAYEEYWADRSSAYSAVYTAELRGKAEGRAEGMAEGEAKGIAKIAQKMKLDGMPIEKIAELTGLSAAEISGI